MSLGKRVRSLTYLTALTAGCVGFPPDGTVPLDQKVDAINVRLTRVERTVNNDTLMNMLARIDQLQAELQSLRNDVETLQNEMQISGQRQRDLYLDIDQRLQDIEKAGLAADESAAALPDGTLLGQLPFLGGSDRKNYDAAFELLKEGRYQEAAGAFNRFMAVYPDSGLI
ncbi:uncharacterized protein METZ01_LOCUS281632, partial [marine metagenome]